MPFSGPNDPELPESIQELPEEKREIWVSAWNAAFDRCQNESGEDCEGVAFRIANSAVEDEAETSMVETISKFMHVELVALADGKPFDGMTHGEFIDRRGQHIKIKKSELAEYVKNTAIAIEAARTEDGELVGLPIDSSNHDRGDAAGWIVGVELAGDVIRLIPKWTKLGLEKVGEGLRRMFSPSFSPTQKVIGGGSLTNWPASLNKKNGQMLLRPIELSQGFYIAEATQPEELTIKANSHEAGKAAAKAFTHSVTAHTDASTEDVTLTEGHAVSVTSGGKQLPPQNLKNLSESQEKTELQQETETQGVLSMEITEEKLQELVAAEVAKGVSVAQQKVLGGDPDIVNSASKGKTSEEVANILEALGQEDFEDKAKAEMVSFFLEKEAAMREYASREAVMQLANIRRKSHIAEFAQKVTDGTDEYPRGLPVTTDRINKFLLSLAPDQATEAQEILEAVQRTGLVEFKEKGHGRRLRGTVELETPVKKMLTKWIAGEGSISEFFEVNASELGDMEQYNLSEFKEKVKE